MALVRSPDERASPRALRSLINAFEPLVELVDVTDAVLCELVDVLASGGGGGCICCMICAKMLWALVKSPDERASPNALRSLANGFVSVLVLDEEAVDEAALFVELTAWKSCISCRNALWAPESLPASSAG